MWYRGSLYFSLLGAIFLTLAPAGTKHEEDLAKELAEKVRQNRLFLAEWRVDGIEDGYLTLFPFAADPRRFLPFSTAGMHGWLSPDGRSIVIASGKKISLVNMRGDVIAERKGIWGIGRLALSSARRKIAFTQVVRRCPDCEANDESTKYFWGSFDSGDDHLITESKVREWNVSLGWAPDERRIVLNIGGDVRIYDTVSSTFQTIAKGSSPTWSPDGRYIAFRTPDHYSKIYDFTTRVFVDVLPSRPVLARLDWSPDSEYLLFSEEHIGWCGSTRLAVARVKDAVAVPVLSLCFGETNANFGWAVVDR